MGPGESVSSESEHQTSVIMDGVCGRTQGSSRKVIPPLQLGPGLSCRSPILNPTPGGLERKIGCPIIWIRPARESSQIPGGTDGLWSALILLCAFAAGDAQAIIVEACIAEIAVTPSALVHRRFSIEIQTARLAFKLVLFHGHHLRSYTRPNRMEASSLMVALASSTVVPIFQGSMNPSI